MMNSAPTKRHPSIAAHTFASANELEQSLTLLDIKDDPTPDSLKKTKYEQNSQVFEEIVEATDVEFVSKEDGPALHRKFSVRNSINADSGRDTSPMKRSAMRRHSTYSEREPEKSYKQHKKMKEYLNSLEYSHKTDVAKMLLDFSMSINMASSRDLSFMNESLAMHYSCPVLSYMNDEEEDSVELTEHKMKGLKRHSMDSIGEGSEQNWETLNDDPSDDTFQSSEEYHMELKKDDDEFEKPRAKKRRPPSCLVLSQKLASDGAQKVLRSFIHSH